MGELNRLFIVMIFFSLFSFSQSEVGIAGPYSAPYVPTACYGSDVTNFPSNNLFAAAGEAIWANGAACGTVYRVRCVSAAGLKEACIQGGSVSVQIVDRAANHVTDSTAALLLNDIAYRKIAAIAASTVTVEFLE